MRWTKGQAAFLPQARFSFLFLRRMGELAFLIIKGWGPTNSVANV